MPVLRETGLPLLERGRTGNHHLAVRQKRRADHTGKVRENLVRKLAERLRRVGEVNYNEFILTFRTQGKEISVFQDGRAIVKGTTDEMTARSLYARYVGT